MIPKVLLYPMRDTRTRDPDALPGRGAPRPNRGGHSGFSQGSRFSLPHARR